MKSGIYCAINVFDGKRYIGSSKEVYRRWTKHCYNLRRGKHNNPHLQGAWNRDGEKTFASVVLEYCEPAALIEREAFWIDHFDSRNQEKGYNLCHPDRHAVSPETRARISAGHKGKMLTAEHRANLSAAKKGRPNGLLGKKRGPLSEETKSALRAAHLGKKQA